MRLNLTWPNIESNRCDLIWPDPILNHIDMTIWNNISSNIWLNLIQIKSYKFNLMWYNSESSRCDYFNCQPETFDHLPNPTRNRLAIDYRALLNLATTGLEVWDRVRVSIVVTKFKRSNYPFSVWQTHAYYMHSILTNLKLN